MTDTQTEAWTEQGLADLERNAKFPVTHNLIAEVRRLRKQNEKLVGLLKETDAYANNIQLEISQLFREMGVKDE